MLLEYFCGCLDYCSVIFWNIVLINVVFFMACSIYFVK
jgi:hypothetical protein